LFQEDVIVRCDPIDGGQPVPKLVEKMIIAITPFREGTIHYSRRIVSGWCKRSDKAVVKEP